MIATLSTLAGLGLALYVVPLLAARDERRQWETLLHEARTAAAARDEA